MRGILDGLDIEIIGLKDIDIKIGPIDESGNNPLTNAKIKALAYYKATKIPVFSCDSGLYIEGLDSNIQPGAHVRRVNGKELSDEEMIDYYTELAANHGGEVKAYYKNAISLIIDENTTFHYDGEDLSSHPFILTSIPHVNRNVGFPLDSISVDIVSGKYYMDIHSNNSRNDDQLAKGFRNFFRNILMNTVSN